MACAVVHISSFVKYVTRVARVSSSMSLQLCVSSFASSRFCEAIAATFVVAFVMPAAFAFVHSATACGFYDPAGGSCFQPGGAATLAALLVASFVFVFLPSVVQEPAGDDGLDFVYVIDDVSTLDSVYWCVDVVSLTSSEVAAAAFLMHHAAASVRLWVPSPCLRVTSAFQTVCSLLQSLPIV